ncbi:hypothetical protein BG004_008213 [Podila humilis]|nr:hypothetical protein BG004_008213 [Podila humilis]
MVHAFFNPAQAATFNELALRKDSTFEVTYFGIHGFGSNARTILALHGAKFESHVPEDWASLKPKTPFGVMPTLKETGVNGQSIEIAESAAINRYLARKFGLLGDNAFEETLINTFVSSISGATVATVKVFAKMEPEALAQLKTTILESNILPWAKYHEQHLAANGSNGHHVGNKLSLADVEAKTLIEMINGLFGNDTITAEKYPALYKVKADIVNHPAFVAWSKTDAYKALDAGNKATLGY